MEKNTEQKKIPLWLALVPFACLIIVMLPSIIILGASPQIPLMMCTGITGLIGILVTGRKWEDIEKAMIDANASAMQANFIIMIVGCLIAAWMAGGIVPGLIYYGLKAFSPGIFLTCLPVICAIVSFSTGSAWTAAGTIGIASMGIAAGLGVPLPVAAGAIITGAQFGDKISPLSDSTNLAAGVTGVNLFDHVKHMLWTTIPSFTIAVCIFAVIGTRYNTDAADVSQINSICQTMQENFIITPWVFIAPLSVIMMIVFRIPAVPGMAFGTIVGVIFAFVQGADAETIMSQMIYGFDITTGNGMVDLLLNRGGMLEMMNTISLVICALAFGGALKSTGCIETITEVILGACKTRGSVMTANVISCIAMNFLTADQYMSIVIPSQMFKDIYAKLNLHPKNLSRLLEDSGTVTSGIVPWSTCGAFYYSTLGVSALFYFPYCFMAYITPIITLAIAFTGFTLTPLDTSKPIKTSVSEDM